VLLGEAIKYLRELFIFAVKGNRPILANWPTGEIRVLKRYSASLYTLRAKT